MIKTSEDILEGILLMEMEAQRAYMLGKRLDVSAVMARLQMESYANIARIRELLEKQMGEKPLDYEPLPEQGIELGGPVDTEERAEEKIIVSG